ncbi:MAG: HAMP domain-containing histidine kinase, partial [Bacteroidetes bacterium]|nr:HAMP domain-containing histidine kinase [Bacteroidota bacterium]
DLALTRPRSSEEYQSSLKVITSEAEKLQSVTRGLLELAQSSFHGTLVYEKVDVDELIYNSLGVARSVYPQCEIRLDKSLQPGVSPTPSAPSQAPHQPAHFIPSKLTLFGNAQLFELALSNILLNACKYSSSKPVTFAIASSSTNIIFIITDQGIGIPDNEIKHIFDPFFRASNAKKTRGYGIGLPLAQNIIRLYKGSIEINSKENIGTEVIVKFPL